MWCEKRNCEGKHFNTHFSEMIGIFRKCLQSRNCHSPTCLSMAPCNSLSTLNALIICTLLIRMHSFLSSNIFVLINVI